MSTSKSFLHPPPFCNPDQTLIIQINLILLFPRGKGYRVRNRRRQTAEGTEKYTWDVKRKRSRNPKTKTTSTTKCDFQLFHSSLSLAELITTKWPTTHTHTQNEPKRIKIVANEHTKDKSHSRFPIFTNWLSGVAVNGKWNVKRV